MNFEFALCNRLARLPHISPVSRPTVPKLKDYPTHTSKTTYAPPARVCVRLGVKSRFGWVMSNWQPATYKDYQWIVADPQLLGGRLAIRGTRLSVSLILECLAAGMSLEDIDEAFDRAFPPEALPEVLKVAAEVTNSVHVAA